MLRATNQRTSGTKTPEFAHLFGTAEAVPSQEPFMRWLLGEWATFPTFS